MAEARHLALVRWGEALRRDRRSRRRARTCIVAALGSTIAVFPFVWRPAPILVWNASASSPTGLYQVSGEGEVRRGDMVVGWPSINARVLAAGRRYLPFGAPLVKRVAAASGDRVCAAGAIVSVNGRVAALRRSEDPSGRPLPRWTGCERLESGEYFLLGASEESFDGRYFGITRGADLIGRARLIWRDER